MSRLRMLLVAAALTSFGAQAQQYPTKPIRLMLSLAGGGENNARIIAERAAEFFGQPLLLEANGAAGGAIAVMNVVRAEPDGYTLLYSTAQTLLFRPYLVKNNPYHPLRDLTPVIQVGEATQSVAASMTLPVTTFAELIAYAKKNPGKVSYATTGIGTTGHLAGSLIERLTGVQMVHVPYKGGTQSLPDLMSGRVQLSFTTLSTFVPMLEKAKVRLLAITQGGRSERVPDVPLVADLLPGYEVPPGWIGIMGPARMPPALVKRAADSLLKAANLPEVKSRIAEVGTTIRTKAPDEFAVSIRQDFEVAGRLIKASGVEPE
jgi:tripartite-type tricarboxylate transporter receptor subunit TctC